MSALQNKLCQKVGETPYHIRLNNNHRKDTKNPNTNEVCQHYNS